MTFHNLAPQMSKLRRCETNVKEPVTNWDHSDSHHFLPFPVFKCQNCAAPADVLAY